MLDGRLNVSTRFAFGAGGIPETLKNASWDMFMMFYLTQVVGISGALAGLVIAIALVTNALIDPSIGSYSDAMPVLRLGRRQTLMAVAVIPFCISFTLLFSAPASLSQGWLFAWIVSAAVVARASISLFTIPYYAMNIELSRSPIERPILTAFRSVGTSAARMILPIIAFTYFFKASPHFPNGQLNRAAYPAFALTLSLVSAVLMVWCILGTNRRSKEVERHASTRRKAYTAASPLTTIRQIAHAFRSTPNVRWLVLMGVFIFISLGVVNVYMLYLTTYYWRLTPDGIRNVAAALPPGALLAALTARYYVPFFDKKHSMLFCIVVYGVMVLIPILGPLTSIFPQPKTPWQLPTLITLHFFAGVSYGAFLVTSATVSADIADELELNAGEPRQALLGSFTFFTMFAASAVVNIAAGGFLQLIGFPTGKAIATVSPIESERLALFSSAIVAFAVIGVVYFVARMSISTEKQAQINTQLEDRYRDNEAAAMAVPL